MSAYTDLPDKFLEFKIAVEFGFDIDFIPRDAGHCDTENALRVQSAASVDHPYGVGALRRDPDKFQNVGGCHQFDFVHVLVVADHCETLLRAKMRWNSLSRSPSGMTLNWLFLPSDDIIVLFILLSIGDGRILCFDGFDRFSG